MTGARVPRTLGAVRALFSSFMFAAGLGATAACGTGDLGMACSADDECGGGLVCHVHDGSGACREAEDGGDEHGDEHETGGDGGDPATALSFDPAPPTTVTADEDFELPYTVSTMGELHVSMVRACMGVVSECGGGDETTFDAMFPATEDGGTYTATVNLAAGEWTVVAYAHVGPDPHTSATVSITAE
jgi:hypothetical protein